MNRELAKKVADAVMYEGYMLYPYRASAIKNRQRWSFGILYPPAYHEVCKGTERSGMHSECLVQARGNANVEVQLRFLHLAASQVAQSSVEPSADRPLKSRDEAVERSLEFSVPLPAKGQQLFDFNFPGKHEWAPLRDNINPDPGTISYTQDEIQGTVSVSSEELHAGVLKLVIDVANTTVLAPDAADRNLALPCSLLSAHTILTLHGGEFVSLLDPPEDLREDASACRNVGNFPVLIGAPDRGEHDMLLCSPIVLYDYPQIAPESAGDFYDATEMDEMLTLRMMTLSDQEKEELRLSGERVRSLLERTEQSAREQLMRTHGAIRSMRPVSEKP